LFFGSWEAFFPLPLIKFIPRLFPPMFHKTFHHFFEPLFFFPPPKFFVPFWLYFWGILFVPRRFVFSLHFLRRTPMLRFWQERQCCLLFYLALSSFIFPLPSCFDLIFLEFWIIRTPPPLVSVSGLPLLITWIFFLSSSRC